MVGHGGSSAGSYLADPTSPLPSHCALIVTTSTVRVNTGRGCPPPPFFEKCNVTPQLKEYCTYSISLCTLPIWAVAYPGFCRCICTFVLCVCGWGRWGGGGVQILPPTPKKKGQESVHNAFCVYFLITPLLRISLLGNNLRWVLSNTIVRLNNRSQNLARMKETTYSLACRA